MKSLIIEEYLKFDEDDAKDALKSIKETVQDIKTRGDEECIPNYFRIAKDDLLDISLAALKFDEYNTNEVKSLMNELQDFLERNGKNAEFKVQLEI